MKLSELDIDVEFIKYICKEVNAQSLILLEQNWEKYYAILRRSNRQKLARSTRETEYFRTFKSYKKTSEQTY